MDGLLEVVLGGVLGGVLRDISKWCGCEVEGRTVIYAVDGIAVGFRWSLT